MANVFKGLIVVLALLTLSQKAFSAKNPGNPNAPQGGVFKYNLGEKPTTVNPLSSTDYYASVVQGYVLETLYDRDIDTYEWRPLLAKEYTVSKDGLTFEFTIRDGVKWHDGKLLSVEDVKFSFDAIMHPQNKYKTAHMKPYFESIKEAVVTGPNKIKFVAKQKYFKNFESIATMTIVPKHIYENPSKEEEKKLNRTLIGTGPFKFLKLEKEKGITLEANPEWWGKKDADHAGEHNYKSILMRFVKDSTIEVQRLEKGDLDFISLTSEQYEQKTKGANWGKNVFKVKTKNISPKGYGFIGWNLEDPKFKSKNVRKALYHLINRELMIEKFRFGYSVPATGPWYVQSEYADKSVPAIKFDPKQALELLRSEGWKDTDGDMILDKEIDGKKVPFSFTILEPSQEFVKYLTIFKEDAKQAGIDVNIKVVEWNTFIKLMDEKKFEGIRLGWSAGSVDNDPKQIWHSASSGEGGSNFINYKNPEVDKLIDQARETMEKPARIKILQKVYKMIAEDYPYAFLFNDDTLFYAHTKQMKRVKDTYNYGVGISYWWIE